jgi:hypothetical protein
MTLTLVAVRTIPPRLVISRRGCRFEPARRIKPPAHFAIVAEYLAERYGCGPVEVVRDLSGHGRHLVQPDPERRPTVVSAISPPSLRQRRARP